MCLQALTLESTLQILGSFHSFSYPLFCLVSDNLNFISAQPRSSYGDPNHKGPLWRSHLISHDREAIFYLQAV